MRIKSFIRPLLASALALCAASATVQALDAPPVKAAAKELPSAKKILDDYSAACGLKDFFKTCTSMELTGTMGIPAMGMEGPMTMYKSSPDMMKMIIKLPGMGETMQSFNGTVAWSMDPSRGPSLMTGEMLDMFKQESSFTAELPETIMKHYDSITVEGASEFNGQMCYELKMVKGKQETTRYYNVKTHLMDGAKTVAPTPMGDIPTTTILSDYKKFGKIMAATKNSMSMMGTEQVLIIKDITFNAVNPSVYALPPAIKALTEAAAKKAAEKPAKNPTSKDAAPADKSAQ